MVGYVHDVPLYASLTLAALSIVVVELVWESGRRAQVLADLRTLDGGFSQLNAHVHRYISLAEGEVSQVPSGAIHQSLQAMLADASEWFFRGGSASWIRKEALPILAERRDRDLPFSTVLLDPRQFDLCEKYARYRRQSSAQPIAESNSKEIQRAILGLIFALGWYQTHRRVRASIALTGHFSPIRLDASQARVMLTVADLDLPALRAEATSWLYRSLLDDFRADFSVGGRLSLPEPNEALFPESPTGSDVQNALIQTHLVTGESLLDGFEGFDEQEFSEILRRSFVKGTAQ